MVTYRPVRRVFIDNYEGESLSSGDNLIVTLSGTIKKSGNNHSTTDSKINEESGELQQIKIKIEVRDDANKNNAALTRI